MILGRPAFTLTLIFGVCTHFRLPPVLAGKCAPCKALPPDCWVTGLPPADGGPPCSCSPFATLRGCILKPCAGALSYGSFCDSSRDKGNLFTSSHFQYRCTGGRGECETCRSAPPDCTEESLYNPPYLGGPACSCETLPIPGCTLKPCNKTLSDFDMTPCICQRGIYSPVCFHSNCPGDSAGSESRMGTATSIVDNNLVAAAYQALARGR